MVICTTSMISGNKMMDAVIETGTFDKINSQAPAAT